jgi:hypothetical protein
VVDLEQISDRGTDAFYSRSLLAAVAETWAHEAHVFGSHGLKKIWGSEGVDVSLTRRSHDEICMSSENLQMMEKEKIWGRRRRWPAYKAISLGGSQTHDEPRSRMFARERLCHGVTTAAGLDT